MSDITPITRRELFYDNILGANNSISPITREEIYLNEIAGNTEETANSKVDWESLGLLGAKNLLSLDLTKLTALNTTGTWSSNAYTHAGITYTVNNDMTITASGTATADSSFIVLSNYTPPALDLILSCTPEEGSETTYYTEIVIDSEDYSDIGEGLSIASDSDPITSATIIIKDGEEITDLVFSPMIRLATDTDTTYQPYAMTNRELTELTVNKQNKIEAKHVIFSNVQIGSEDTVYYTQNDIITAGQISEETLMIIVCDGAQAVTSWSEIDCNVFYDVVLNKWGLYNRGTGGNAHISFTVMYHY